MDGKKAHSRAHTHRLAVKEQSRTIKLLDCVSNTVVREAKKEEVLEHPHRFTRHNMAPVEQNQLQRFLALDSKMDEWGIQNERARRITFASLISMGFTVNETTEEEQLVDIILSELVSSLPRARINGRTTSCILIHVCNCYLALIPSGRVYVVQHSTKMESFLQTLNNEARGPRVSTKKASGMAMMRPIEVKDLYKFQVGFILISKLALNSPKNAIHGVFNNTKVVIASIKDSTWVFRSYDEIIIDLINKDISIPLQ